MDDRASICHLCLPLHWQLWHHGQLPVPAAPSGIGPSSVHSWQDRDSPARAEPCSGSWRHKGSLQVLSGFTRESRWPSRMAMGRWVQGQTGKFVHKSGSRPGECNQHHTQPSDHCAGLRSNWYICLQARVRIDRVCGQAVCAMPVLQQKVVGRCSVAVVAPSTVLEQERGKPPSLPHPPPPRRAGFAEKENLSSFPSDQ